MREQPPAAGDDRSRDGFEDFLARALPRLLRFGHVLTGSPAEAEDLVQEALARCLRRAERDPLRRALASLPARQRPCSCSATSKTSRIRRSPLCSAAGRAPSGGPDIVVAPGGRTVYVTDGQGIFGISTTSVPDRVISLSGGADPMAITPDGKVDPARRHAVRRGHNARQQDRLCHRVWRPGRHGFGLPGRHRRRPEA